MCCGQAKVFCFIRLMMQIFTEHLTFELCLVYKVKSTKFNPVIQTVEIFCSDFFSMPFFIFLNQNCFLFKFSLVMSFACMLSENIFQKHQYFLNEYEGLRAVQVRTTNFIVFEADASFTLNKSKWMHSKVTPKVYINKISQPKHKIICFSKNALKKHLIMENIR